jgi:O-antigen/teichoic acid export membrane protein
MKKAIMLVTLFNFLGAGITFFINVILARVFPYEIFGRINLLFSYNAILIILFMFGFSNSTVVFYNKNKTSELDKSLLNTITNRYLIYLLWVFPLFCVIIYTLDYFYKLTFLEVMFLLTSTLFSAIYTFFSTYYQALGEWNKYNFLNIFFNILKGIVVVMGALLLTLIFKVKVSYELFLKLYILYACVLLVFSVIYSFSLIGFKKDNSYNLKEFYRIVVPIGFANIIIGFSMRLDNIIIDRFLGDKQVAIYAAANTLALVFPLITGSIMGVLMKEISKDSLFYLKKIIDFQKKYLLYLLGTIAAVVVISPYLIRMFFGIKYINSIPIFQILIVTYIASVFFTPIESYFYNEDAKLVFIVKLVQLIIFLGSSLILIQKFALPGVAVSVFLTRVGAWGFFYVLARKRTHV